MTGILDQQVGFADEDSYNVSVTPTRFFEFDSEGIEETEGRTEGDPLRVGTFVKRNDRFTPYFSGAAGSVTMAVMSKGFGYFLKHMLGQVATSGPEETNVYTHTGSMADLFGKSFTCQVGRPLNPSGTVQPFTYAGGKITEWTLSNDVDGNLMAELAMDFASVDTDAALASAAYPSAMENFTWAGGVVTVGGSAFDITNVSLACNNTLNVDRRQIRGNTDKKEPTGGRREVTWSMTADFDSMAQRNRAHAEARSDALAAVVATWTGPTLLGTTIYPTLQVSIPAGRFDSWKGANEGPEGINQELTGVGLFDGSNSAVSVIYKSADTTP